MWEPLGVLAGHLADWVHHERRCTVTIGYRKQTTLRLGTGLAAATASISITGMPVTQNLPMQASCKHHRTLGIQQHNKDLLSPGHHNMPLSWEGREVPTCTPGGLPLTMSASSGRPSGSQRAA